MTKPRYLLDTDTCIYIINQRPPSVRKRFATLTPSSVAMSAITYHELYYGALNSQKIEQNLQALQALASRVIALPWTKAAAMQSAKVRAALKRHGQPIGSWDLQIAGHALALNAVLVSNNAREFAKIEGLRLENWVEAH